jgi:quinol monooxygenase YgiN
MRSCAPSSSCCSSPRARTRCLRYHFHRDVENHDAFSFVEHRQEWEDLANHFRSAHVGGFLAVLPDLLEADPQGRLSVRRPHRGLEMIEEAWRAIPA